MQPGTLIYLMGPPGAGKDTLIDAARPVLAQRGIEVVQRVITRSAESVGECALGVDEAGFERLRAQGAFALYWQANGLHYGIPASIDACLAARTGVLVNGSRGALPQALGRYPGLLPILLTVNAAVLRERLLRRGREDNAQIEQRLRRHEQLNEEAGQWAAGAGIQRLDNSGRLEDSVAGLLLLVENAHQRS